LRQAAIRFMARQSQGVITTNQADFQALAGRLGPTSLVQIPIGSNIRPRPADAAIIHAARQRLGLAPDARLVAYFGFVSESKGGELLLRSLAQVEPGTHLLFIGGRTGSSAGGGNVAYQQRLEGLIADLGLSGRVHWTGFIPQEEVSTYLHMADLMVLPYLDGASWRRGSLMAVLAHGRPLITTTPETPMPELVHQRNVHLVPAGDVAALAHAIQLLADDPETRALLGEGAVEVASHFSWEKISRQTADFYATLARERPAGRKT
jgi:glycosyltransferase involved in cell wall biosynthesis